MIRLSAQFLYVVIITCKSVMYCWTNILMQKWKWSVKWYTVMGQTYDLHKVKLNELHNITTCVIISICKDVQHDFSFRLSLMTFVPIALIKLNDWNISEIHYFIASSTSSIWISTFLKIKTCELEYKIIWANKTKEVIHQRCRRGVEKCFLDNLLARSW